MVDNVTLDPGTGGAVIATDDIGGAQYQLIKIAYGALDTATLVTGGVGLPVAPDTDGFAVEATLQAGTAEIGKLAAGAAEIGNVKNAGTFATQVDGAALTALQLIDNVVLIEDAVAAGGASGVMTLAVRNDVLASLVTTDGDYAPLQVNASGALFIQEGAALDVSGATVTIAGTVTANLGATDNAVLDAIAASVAGTVTVDGSAVTQPVSGTVTANLSATDNAVLDTIDAVLDLINAKLVTGTVIGDVNLGATDNAVLDSIVTNQAALATGGCKMFSSIDLDESEEQVTASACTLYGLYCWNSTAAPLWLQVFNIASASVTVGTTAPTHNFLIPANADSDGAGVVIPIPDKGAAFSTALTLAMTTGSGTTAGAPGANAGGVFALYQD